MSNDLREQLAAQEHDQWAVWTAYMLKTLGLDRDPEELLRLIRIDEDASPVHLMYQPVFTREQVDAIVRWQRQIKTPYAELSEKEKDSDREWADKAIALILDHPETP